MTDDEYIPEPVRCPFCDWFGMSDDCQYNECPACGRRVVREEVKDEEREI